jgi:hypothetical protein
MVQQRHSHFECDGHARAVGVPKETFPDVAR